MPVRSETRLFAQLLGECLKTPFLLVLVLLGRRPSSVLWNPFRTVGSWVAQTPWTNGIIIVTTLTTFGAWLFVTPETFDALVNYPGDLFVPTRWFSLVSSGLIHADLGHWFGNTLILFGFGRLVERELGGPKTLGVYVIALLLSSLSDMLAGLVMGSANGGLGASGAISGLVVVGMLLAPFTIIYEYVIPMPAMIAGWVAIWYDLTGFLVPSGDGIAYAAHLGGYLSVVAVFIVLHEDRRKLLKGILTNAGVAIMVGAFLVWF